MQLDTCSKVMQSEVEFVLLQVHSSFFCIALLSVRNGNLADIWLADCRELCEQLSFKA